MDDSGSNDRRYRMGFRPGRVRNVDVPQPFVLVNVLPGATGDKGSTRGPRRQFFEDAEWLKRIEILLGGFKHLDYFPFHIWECHHPN